MNESAERSKQPKLTMMEEVLLLGLKDKQVGDSMLHCESEADRCWCYRDISLSGTITFHMH